MQEANLLITEFSIYTFSAIAKISSNHNILRFLVTLLNHGFAQTCTGIYGPAWFLIKKAHQAHPSTPLSLRGSAFCYQGLQPKVSMSVSVSWAVLLILLSSCIPIPSYSLLLTCYLWFCWEFCVWKRERTLMRLVKIFKYKPCEKQLRELELFKMEKSGLREDPIALFNKTRSCGKVSLGSSLRQQAITWVKMSLNCIRGCLDWILLKMFS